MIKRRTVFDGQCFYRIPDGQSIGDWIRASSTELLERVASKDARFVDLHPRAVHRMVCRELASRRPALDRAIETATHVGARRRWTYLLPVFTNYSNGGSH